MRRKTRGAVAPTPVKTESRICFGIMWYATEEDAQTAHRLVRAQGQTYNGGFFHGMPCGRAREFDTTDKVTGAKLFAVTGR